MREKIFVSYSHQDASWCDLLLKILGTGIWAKTFEMWSDQKVKPGTDWEQKITAAIASSRVALLLVSNDFLASNFIINKELKSILRRNALSRPGQPEGLSIWWIALDRIDEEVLQRAELEKFQAALNPRRPLAEMNERERADAIRELGTRLTKEFKSLRDTSALARDEFLSRVADVLGSVNTVIDEPFAPGDNSIVYRGRRQDNAEVAVKALIPSPGREWLGKDFIDRANSVRNITNATAIGIRDIFDSEQIKCVVMEFVSAQTLKAQLKEGFLPSIQEVANILAQLANVAADLHRMDGQPIIGPIRPSQVHFDKLTKKVRISLVHIANETFRSCQQRPTLLLDYDALTYLSPERYWGQKTDAYTDQYYLGLLGLELLQGKLPVEVSTFADLENKRRFFDSPREYFPDLPVRQPAFSFVLTKMLQKDPQNRWSSMSELVKALRELAEGKVPEFVKVKVRTEYKNKLRRNTNFFDSFYRALLTQSNEIRTIFAQHGVTTEKQCQKLKKQSQNLDHAVSHLLTADISFVKPHSSFELTPLDDQAESHRMLGVKAEHFDLFRATFLQALRNAQITDVYSEDAWRALLDPAISFMSERASSEPVKLASRRASFGKAGVEFLAEDDGGPACG
jgi:serine/threonine protein kinase